MRPVVLLLLLALVAPACDLTSDPGLSLADVGVVETDVRELQLLRFDGLQQADLSDLSELAVDARVEGGDAVPLPLYADDEGAYTIVPLYTVERGSGGRLLLRLSTPDQVGPDLPIDVQALPRADGAWERLLADVEQALSATAARLGTDLDGLRATDLSTLPPAQAAAALLALLVDDGTGDGLAGLADGLAAPASTLLDAVVAELDPLALWPDLLPAPEAGVRAADASGGVRPLGRSAAPSGLAAAPSSGTCSPSEVQISGPASLSAAMATGMAAARGGVRQRLQEDLQRTVGGLSATAKDGMTLSPGSLGQAGEVFDSVADVVSALLVLYAILDLGRRIDAGVNPTAFESIDVQTSIRRFNEDFTRRGAVTSAVVVATSTGFDGDAEAADIVGTLVDMAIGVFTKRMTDELPYAEKLINEAGTRFRGLLAGRVLHALSDGTYTWCPDRWEVDIAEPGFLWLTSATGALQTAEITYWPRSVGTDELRVAAEPSAFGGATATARVLVDIDELRVTPRPASVYVDHPGDPAPVQVHVRADTRHLQWDTTNGTWATGGRSLHTTSDAAVQTQTLLTPADPDAYPVQVTITSTSDTGLRRGATDERSADVLVRLRQLVVDPDPATVAVGQQVTFTASGPDEHSRGATWEATGGDIDDSGTFTAGDVPGTYAVTATSPSDPTVQDTAVVEVVEACSFGFAFDGTVGPGGSWDGPFAGRVSGTVGDGEHGMLVITHAAGADLEITPSDGVTSIDLRGPFSVWLFTEPGAPLMGPGGYHGTATATLGRSTDQVHRFDGPMEIRIADSSFGIHDGRRYLESMTGTFRSAQPLHLVFPTIEGTATIVDGTFSISSASCPGALDTTWTG